MFLSSLAHDNNNNNILALPLAVFIALMLVGPSKCLKQIFQKKLTVQATGNAALHTVSCMEICHIACKFHGKNTHKTLV